MEQHREPRSPHGYFSLSISKPVHTAVERALKRLEEGEWLHARRLFQQAESKAAHADEYGMLAGLIVSDLEDPEWGRRVLLKGREVALSATALATLAGYACQNKDRELAQIILSDAEDHIISVPDAMEAAAIADAFSHDESIGERLYRTAEALASTSSDFIVMARSMAWMSAEQTRRYLSCALDVATTCEDREIVAEAVEDYLHDLQLAASIRQRMSRNHNHSYPSY